MMNVTVLNSDKVEHMLGYAPEAATEYMRRWLYHERKTFVGNKRVDGVFRRELKQKTNNRGTRWKPYAAKRFKGYVNPKNNIQGMALHMGPNLLGIKKLRYGRKGLTGQGLGAVLEKMENSYTIRPKNAKWLMLPNRKNLAKLGIRSKYWIKMYEMARSGLLTFVENEDNRSISAFLDEDRNKKQKRQFRKSFGGQLFYGVRKINVKKQFSFINAWNTRIPQALKRGDRYLGMAMRNVDKADKKQWEL